jgi:glycosyltransferase involved in cell wall biosynthesis
MKTDVCMILEGSYPYVVGGVSTWVHDLLTSMKDVSFSLVHIGVSRESAEEPKYEFPPNVLEFRQVPLMDTISWRGPRFARKKKAWEALEGFIDELGRNDTSGVRAILERLDPSNRDAITPYDVFHGKDFWNLLVRRYQQNYPEFSFIDFFWTLRFMALPLFRILYAELPEARLYHATCTGYAGLLGAVASVRTGAPLVITEHGIYTNERMIEITQAHWIYREKPSSLVPTKQVGALQSMWMQKFELLSRIAYDHAARIYTLYEGNRQLQVQGGAPPEKTGIIPNGIDIERFDGLSLEHQDGRRGPPRVCMVGRVAPIKDVKTFIRAAKMVSEEMPEVRFQILGGRDEDESYFDECERLVRVLSLKNVFEFTGAVNMKDYYPGMSCLVMTSISEAQPFVLLEAMRVGIPVVASSVGACAELIFGSGSDDEAIGPAGYITNVRSPRETADAILAILRDPDKARVMGDAGRERVGRYYVRRAMLDAYRDVYRQFCGGS